MTEARKPDPGPVVPRRTLAAQSSAKPAPAPRQPLSERVAAAIRPAKAPAPPSAATTLSSSTAPSVTTPASGAPATNRPIIPPAAPTPTKAASQKSAQKAAQEPTQRAGAKPGTRQRKARLRLVHVDPWSVMKTAFLLAVAVGVVTVVAVAIVWGVLAVAGVWDSINKTVVDVVGSDSGSGFDIRDYLGGPRVLGFTMLVAVLDVVLITAIATLGAFLYNLAASLLGGLEVTFVEDDH